MVRKLTAGLFLSLDGVYESPDRWVFPYFDEELGQIIGSRMESSDTVLLGRRTYEEWAAYWPGKTAADDPFADYINSTPKFVVSTTLASAGWAKSTVVRDIDELRKLKQQPSGKEISITGSGTLVRSLLRASLLDELDLLVFPVVIGSGKRLFDDIGERLPLKLAESRALSKGVLRLIYVPEDRDLAGSASGGAAARSQR